MGGVPQELLWRYIFGIGAILSAFGLVLRFVATKDAKKFTDSKAAAARRFASKQNVKLSEVKR